MPCTHRPSFLVCATTNFGAGISAYCLLLGSKFGWWVKDMNAIASIFLHIVARTELLIVSRTHIQDMYMFFCFFSQYTVV